MPVQSLALRRLATGCALSTGLLSPAIAARPAVLTHVHGLAACTRDGVCLPEVWR